MSRALNPLAGAQPRTSRVVSGVSTNATSVKSTPGVVHSFVFTNTTASQKYVRFYDLAVAPTVGSSTILFTVGVPANGSVVYDGDVGISFLTGIALSITGAAADSDTTNTAANDVFVNLVYS